MRKKRDDKGLIKALRYRDQSVRISAAEALGFHTMVHAMEPLIQTLKDKNWNVRRKAAWALGMI